MKDEPIKPIPDNWKSIERELRTFYRELPQLIADGEQGKFVVIRGEELFDTWDTSHDSRQFGNRFFADGKFISQQVDSRMLHALEPYFGKATTGARPLQEVA